MSDLWANRLTASSGDSLWDSIRWLLRQQKSSIVCKIGSKKFRLSHTDLRALKLLSQMVEYRPEPADTNWILFWRNSIREIERLDPQIALTIIIYHTEHERERILAIWLRGRCGGTFGKAHVYEYFQAADNALRKEVTRCLKRLSAWPELREIAANDPDPRIQHMAAQAKPKPYADRLSAFSEHAEHLEMEASEFDLFVSSEVDLTHEHPPKSLSLIRRILQDIRRLLTENLR